MALFTLFLIFLDKEILPRPSLLLMKLTTPLIRINVSYHLHVRIGPVVFAELPDVNDVSVKYQYFGLNGFKVAVEFFGVAAVCS